MNKNVNKNPVIEIRCLDANTGDNHHDEAGIQLYWEEYDCGLLILPNEPSVHLVAHSETMQNVLLTYWSVTGMHDVALGVYEEEGLAGLINICKFFLDKISEHFTKGIDEYETKGIA